MHQLKNKIPREHFSSSLLPLSRQLLRVCVCCWLSAAADSLHHHQPTTYGHQGDHRQPPGYRKTLPGSLLPPVSVVGVVLYRLAGAIPIVSATIPTSFSHHRLSSIVIPHQ